MVRPHCIACEYGESPGASAMRDAKFLRIAEALRAPGPIWQQGLQTHRVKLSAPARWEIHRGPPATCRECHTNQTILDIAKAREARLPDLRAEVEKLALRNAFLKDIPWKGPMSGSESKTAYRQDTRSSGTGERMEFEKGQKLRVKDVAGLSDRLDPSGKEQLKAGDIVTAQKDEFGFTHIDERAGGYFSWRFELAPEKPAFAPKFKKGQRLLVVDGTGESIVTGDIVVASGDSHLTSLGNEAVTLEGQPAFKAYYATRFKAAPAEKGFKNGQKLVVLDAKKSAGYLKEGETVTANGDAWRGIDGKEIVQVKSEKTGKAGTFYAERFAALPEEKKQEAPKYAYLVTEPDGFQYYTADLNEASEGDSVAEYTFFHSGTLKEHAPTID
jgi:hypothetical protein